jgi:RNA polymerase sigma-70 factor (ECF subfamily)
MPVMGIREGAVAAATDRDALLLAAARGDRAAFERLYRTCAPQLNALARRIVGRREIAEDVLQTAMVAAWRHKATFDPERGSAFAWLGRIVRNLAIDHLRRHGREAPLDPIALEATADEGPDPASAAEASEAARRLRRCLGEVEAAPRRAVLLVYYGGATLEEASSRLAAPIGTVKSWVRRTLIRLRSCLEREEREVRRS